MEVKLLGTQERWQEDLFVAGPLSSLIPDDHILKQVDKVLDLSWLRRDVSEVYCHTNGRPGIDPEAAVRLMLAGFFQGIVGSQQSYADSAALGRRTLQANLPENGSVLYRRKLSQRRDGSC